MMPGPRALILLFQVEACVCCSAIISFRLFQTALLNRALSVDDLSEITDEASAVEKLGIRPRLVQGDTRNLKLTLPQDEYIVRLLLKAV